MLSKRVFLAVALLIVLAESVAPANGQRPWAWTKKFDKRPVGRFDRLLDGIYQIESSGGRNCVESSAGALSCYQILPATADMLKCSPFYVWRGNEHLARDCARAWLARGYRKCRRKDDYSLARYYYRGRCLRPGAKPWAYEMDVVREMLTVERR